MPRTQRRGLTRDEEQDEADRQTSSLGGLAVALLVVVASVVVIQHLAARAAIEDCLMAGRLNCDILVAGVR